MPNNRPPLPTWASVAIVFGFYMTVIVVALVAFNA